MQKTLIERQWVDYEMASYLCELFEIKFQIKFVILYCLFISQHFDTEALFSDCELEIKTKALAPKASLAVAL